MKRFWILIILSISLILQACMGENPYGEAQATTQTPTTTEDPDVSNAPNAPYYRSALAAELAVYLTTDDPLYLRIINKTVNEFGNEFYEPTNLTPLEAELAPPSKEILLEARTAQAVRAMLAEMKHDGIRDVMVTSGYRSNERQKQLFNLYLQNEMSGFTDDAYACLGTAYIEDKYDLTTDTGLDLADANRVVLSYAALPGTSEHQTGLCVDLITANMTELTNEFERSAAFFWLTQNAHRFGFILRYAKDKTDETGYAYESWHYRYVGRDVATEIRESGVTLEQYRASLTQ